MASKKATAPKKAIKKVVKKNTASPAEPLQEERKNEGKKINYFGGCPTPKGDAKSVTVSFAVRKAPRSIDERIADFREDVSQYEKGFHDAELRFKPGFADRFYQAAGKILFICAIAIGLFKIALWLITL